jgi:hypothetical protein
MDNNSLPEIAHEIANEIVSGNEFHVDAGATVLKLWQLDKEKITALRLLGLEGVNL